MKDNKFEENAKRVLEEKDKNINNEKDPYKASAEKIEDITGKKNLGTVQRKDISDFKSADMLLGWHNIYVDELPSSGKFYEKDIKIQIRAAKVNEIRHWSTLNEQDLFDIEDKLNYILQNCTKMLIEGKMLSWKDIREEDKIFILLKIRDLTFPEPEAKLQFKKKCSDCGTELNVEIKPENFILNKVPDNIEKYYSDVERAYIIQTKSSGVIKMAPPSVGVMKIITDYVNKKRQNDEGWEKPWIQILPYLQIDWRGFTDDDIFDGEIDFKGWSTLKYNTVYTLAEKMKIGVKPNIKQICSGCGAEVATRVDFPGGIKTLFMLSDISGELL